MGHVVEPNAPATLNAGFSSMRGGSAGIQASLLRHHFDVGCLRPWIDDSYRDSYITVTQNVGMNAGKQSNLVHNADATLRKNDWLLIDQAVIAAAKPRLRLFGDLRAAGLNYSIPQGLGKTVLESQSVSDISAAHLSMDGRNRGNNDRPEFDLVGIPLCIASKDVSFGIREIEISRNTNTPLDTTSLELASRRVSEQVEKLTSGETSYSFGGYSTYGYANYPSRITKTITAPTAGGWVPSTTITEVLDMRQKSVNKFHRGPWMLYTSLPWDAFLDADYYVSITSGAVAPQKTLRQRLKEIDGIQDVRTADFLDPTHFTMVLVQFTSDVVRAVTAVEMVTVQWTSLDGMEVGFKVMCVMVPQLRADFNGNTGIVHGTST